MVTFEVELDSRDDSTFLMVLDAEEQAGPMLSVLINRPSRTSEQFITISLDGFPRHTITVNDHAMISERSGILLERVLSSAGWVASHYAVQVDGIQDTVTLSNMDMDSLDPRPWLVLDVGRSSESSVSLMVVGANGNLIRQIEAIRRIRVYKQ